MNTELIERQTVTAIIDNVGQAKTEIKQAIELLRSAKARLNATINSDFEIDRYSLDPLHESDIYDFITQNSWRYILVKTGLKQYMTEKRQKELEAQIKANSLPPLTAENIFATINGLAGRIDTLLTESIKEVFRWLRPQSDWGAGALKTNHKFYVGKKAIVGSAIRSNYSGGFQVNYYYDQNFIGLGNVFSLLDGKGVMQYPNDLRSKFNEAMKNREAGSKYEDDYFTLKCYGNGNLHIEFKRADLLAKLNQIGGDGSLAESESKAA